MTQAAVRTEGTCGTWLPYIRRGDVGRVYTSTLAFDDGPVYRIAPRLQEKISLARLGQQ